MEKLRENNEWEKLHAEQINASRTVQVTRLGGGRGRVGGALVRCGTGFMQSRSMPAGQCR